MNNSRVFQIIDSVPSSVTFAQSKFIILNCRLAQRAVKSFTFNSDLDKSFMFSQNRSIMSYQGRCNCASIQILLVDQPSESVICHWYGCTITFLNRNF